VVPQQVSLHNCLWFMIRCVSVLQSNLSACPQCSNRSSSHWCGCHWIPKCSQVELETDHRVHASLASFVLFSLPFPYRILQGVAIGYVVSLAFAVFTGQIFSSPLDLRSLASGCLPFKNWDVSGLPSTRARTDTRAIRPQLQRLFSADDAYRMLSSCMEIHCQEIVHPPHRLILHPPASPSPSPTTPLING
jgi:hypothetical protein